MLLLGQTHLMVFEFWKVAHLGLQLYILEDKGAWLKICLLSLGDSHVLFLSSNLKVASL